MDQGRREVERLKALRFPRSYKEVNGCHFEAEAKSNKFPFVILVIGVILLLSVL
tara:strand:+ start:288 stop:449 length:162 start_codon:yes stop_codon:yes gene_type:complete